MGYLLDTDIVVFLLRGKKGIAEKLSEIEPKDIYISEITVAELEYGNHCSGRYAENKKLVDRFVNSVNVAPITKAVPIFAAEKFRLKNEGTPIEDFDLLIGSTAVSQKLKMVTNNMKHYQRISGISIESWTE